MIILFSCVNFGNFSIKGLRQTKKKKWHKSVLRGTTQIGRMPMRMKFQFQFRFNIFEKSFLKLQAIHGLLVSQSIFSQGYPEGKVNGFRTCIKMIDRASIFLF